MIGIGYTAEGLPNSYFTTDLLFEMGYRNESVDLKKWTRKYVTRRYGLNESREVHYSDLMDGWLALLPRVFNSSDRFHHRKFLVARLPTLTWKEPTPSHLSGMFWGKKSTSPICVCYVHLLPFSRRGIDP